MKTERLQRILGAELDARDFALVIVSIGAVFRFSHSVQIHVSRGFGGLSEGAMIVVMPAVIIGLFLVVVALCFGERRRAMLYGVVTMLLAATYLLLSPSWVIHPGGFAQ